MGPVLALISQQCFGNPCTVCIHSVICLPVVDIQSASKLCCWKESGCGLFCVDLFMCALG